MTHSSQKKVKDRTTALHQTDYCNMQKLILQHAEADNFNMKKLITATKK